MIENIIQFVVTKSSILIWHLTIGSFEILIIIIYIGAPATEISSRLEIYGISQKAIFLI